MGLGLGFGLKSDSKKHPPGPSSGKQLYLEGYKEESDEVKEYPHYCAIVLDKTGYDLDRYFITCLPAIKGEHEQFYTLNEWNSDDPNPILFIKNEDQRTTTTHRNEAQRTKTKSGKEVAMVYHGLTHAYYMRLTEWNYLSLKDTE